MKNKLHFSPESLRDLDEIWDYMMIEFCNSDASLNVVNGIMDTIDKLKDFAEMGAPLSSVAEVETNYRFLLSGNYMVFYHPKGTNIYIDRILYGRRDYLRFLFEDLPNN
ncbi:type II toxin-antitoxin system RelE/ParE family toxin [Bacillaceae bacterium Marseille-Q3522]|nr:type II toxin-antitoxin system RelE/ParE family toxin [Bacillaceae bacterium Marseille-Q3522]